MNAYFQHLLYYKSERKEFNNNSDDCQIQHYNPLPENWSEIFIRYYRWLPSNKTKWDNFSKPDIIKQSPLQLDFPL